jgi:hypothetical protein
MRGAFTASLASILLLPAPAGGYVRERTAAGTPLRWQNACPIFALDPTENPDVPHDRLRAALGRSAAAWSDPAAACHSPTVRLTDRAADNLLRWRLPGFCDDDANALDPVCLAPSTGAVTTLVFRDAPGDAHDGEILRETLELNATHVGFSADGALGRYDLETILTHELGHVLGLAHACIAPGSAPATDSMGQPVPSCYPMEDLPPAVLHAAMFAFIAPGETDRRSPLDEERVGVCEIYADASLPCEASA